MSKHTLGPWVLSEGDTSVWGPNHQHIRIATIITHLPSNGVDYHANARLIAAAPELLEALQSLIAARDNNGAIFPSGALIALCKDAIAKATGNNSGH